MSVMVKPKIRCAVYTRKSHEEGLEQEFNSLDAQREAAEAYIAAQRHEGWLLYPDRFDDGGFTGGNIERPALKRLMADIEAGKIDVVVVYKIDRLTRSLTDFSKLIEVFEKHNVSFVSVTQQFNTTTSMGRLVLNVLLSFAQFEREVTGERIRDKLAASKRKGMWMGGVPPLGYDIIDRKLIINEQEAETVRFIFTRFLYTRSITAVALETREKGYRSKTHTSRKGNTRPGKLLDKGFIYKLVTNPIYIGQIVHKDQSYPGQHAPIIGQPLWDQVQAVFKVSPRTRGNEYRRQIGAALRGLIKCGGCSSGMTTTATRRRGRLYRYYTPNAYMKKSCLDCPVGSVSAGEMEEIVLGQLRGVFTAPKVVAETWKQARQSNPDIAMADVHKSLSNILEVWNELFPAEQERLMRQIVREIVIKPDGMDIFLHQNDLSTLITGVNA